MTENPDDNKLVSAFELSRLTGIPLTTVIRMANKNRIPFVDATKPWHERRFLKFDPDAVREALGILKAS